MPAGHDLGADVFAGDQHFHGERGDCRQRAGDRQAEADEQHGGDGEPTRLADEQREHRRAGQRPSNGAKRDRRVERERTAVEGLTLDGTWSVRLEGGERLEADAVLLAVPAYAAAKLVAVNS